MLRDIDIGMEYTSSPTEETRYFNNSSNCVTDYFLRLLGKLQIGNIKKIVIDCINDPNYIPQNNIGNDKLGVEIIKKSINLESYLILSNKNKKVWMLNLLRESFCLLNQYYDFSISAIEKVIKIIEESDYVNHYYYKKTVFNANRKIRAQFWVEHEIEKWSLFLHLSSDNNIFKKKVLIIETPPSWTNYSYMLGSIKWIDNDLVIIYNKKNRVLKKIYLSKI